MGIGPLMGYPHTPQKWDGTQPSRAAPQLCPLPRGPVRGCPEDAQGKRDGMGGHNAWCAFSPHPEWCHCPLVPHLGGGPCSPPAIPCVPPCSPTAPCPLPRSALSLMGRWPHGVPLPGSPPSPPWESPQSPPWGWLLVPLSHPRKALQSLSHHVGGPVSHIGVSPLPFLGGFPIPHLGWSLPEVAPVPCLGGSRTLRARFPARGVRLPGGGPAALRG